jgi:hypothetical protein
MSLNAYDLSAGVFVRGLTNLKLQLTKAEDHAAARGDVKPHCWTHDSARRRKALRVTLGMTFI